MRRMLGIAMACCLLPVVPASLFGQAQPSPIHKPAARHKRPLKPEPEVVAPAPVVPAPVIPERPKWPAFDSAAKAAVVWDSQGLRIDAANSSLQQILKDVSVATGIKVEGAASDERIFGTYGPGNARDVLSQLLQGSSYNVIMVGDLGQGAPRQLLLSARQGGPLQAPPRPNPVANEEDNDIEEEPVQPEPPQMRPNFPPGMPARTPQQIMQEMQQRQQQMQQQIQPQMQPPQPQPQNEQ